MSEWKDTTLGALCVKIGSGATPTGGKSAYCGSGISLIRSQNVLDFSFSEDGLAFINDFQAKKLDGVTVKENDVLLNITGDSVARVCIVPQEYLPARVNQHVAIIRPQKDIFDYAFCLYLLQKEKKKLLSLASTGGTRNALTKNMLEDYSVSIPDFPTQRRIAAILSSLDAKIENNNKVNAKLEEIAQNLFKEWFVDFGPFKNGKFVDSELGPIPEGWRVGTLGDILDIKYGKDHKKLEEGNIPVYGSGGLMRFANKFLYDKESVLIPRKGTLNNIMYVTEPFWTVDTMFYSEIKIPNSGIFTYQFLSKKDMNQLNSGTSIPSMTTEILNKQKLVIPSDKTFLDYYSIVKSLYERIKHNELESIKISNLRDTLLPKLMSGEIEV